LDVEEQLAQAARKTVTAKDEDVLSWFRSHDFTKKEGESIIEMARSEAGGCPHRLAARPGRHRACPQDPARRRAGHLRGARLAAPHYRVTVALSINQLQPQASAWGFSCSGVIGGLSPDLSLPEGESRRLGGGLLPVRLKEGADLG